MPQNLIYAVTFPKGQKLHLIPAKGPVNRKSLCKQVEPEEGWTTFESKPDGYRPCYRCEMINDKRSA